MKDKIIKRIDDCLDEMYRKSDNVFGIEDLHIGFVELDGLLKVMIENGDYKKGDMMLDLFYLPDEEYRSIMDKYCKGLRWSWRWPRRTEMDDDGKLVPDPEWDKYIAANDEMYKKLEAKEITRKEYNKWNAEQAKKYGMERRCYDAETIRFNAMNYSPNGNIDTFNKLSSIIAGIEGFTPEEAEAYMIAYGANEHEIKLVKTLLPFKQYLLDFKNGKYESIRQ